MATRMDDMIQFVRERIQVFRTPGSNSNSSSSSQLREVRFLENGGGNACLWLGFLDIGDSGEDEIGN